MATGHVAGSGRGLDASNESNAHPIVCFLRGGGVCLSHLFVSFLFCSRRPNKVGACCQDSASSTPLLQASLARRMPDTLEVVHPDPTAPREATSLARPCLLKGPPVAPRCLARHTWGL